MFVFNPSGIRPDNAEMIEGETKGFTFNLTPMAGASSITGTPTITCDGLTISGTAISGKTVTTTVSGGTGDRDYILTLSAVLSSGETRIGAVKLECKTAGHSDRAASN